MRPLALLFAALAPALLACPGPTCESSTVTTVGAEQLPRGWADDSGPASVSLSTPSGFSCDVAAVPETVEAQVLSPTNASVPATTDKVTLDAGFGMAPSTTVTFTPSEGPGTYLVTATFLPVGGRSSAAVLVVRDRRGEAPDTVPGPCASLAHLPSGTWLCDGLARFPGGQTQRVAPATATVLSAGATLWVDTGATLTAYREEAGVLVAQGSVDNVGTRKVVPSEDRAFRFSRDGVDALALDASGLHVTAQSAGVPHDSDAWASPHGNLLYAAESTASQDGRGGSYFVVCSYDADNGLKQVGCANVRGTPWGGADGVLLTSDTTQVRAYAPGPAGRLLLVDTLTYPQSLQLLDRAFSSVTPAWPQVSAPEDGATFVARVRSGRILLEHFPAFPLGARGQVDVTWGSISGTVHAWPNLP